MPVGASNGLSARRPFDRWFRYPAGFSPQALAAAFDAVGDGEDQLLVDPFAGSASAGTHTVLRGGVYVGVEAHPLIAELAQLKFARPGEPATLVTAAEEVAASAKRGPIHDETDLVQRCFSDDSLRALTGIRTALFEGSGGTWSLHLKWALLGTLRDVAEVKVGWPYQRPAVGREAPYLNPLKRFVARAQMMASDLERASKPSASRVIQGDSSKASAWQRALASRRADGCITSPPYLNNFDYADATRLEVYFWGEARTWAELCSKVRADMLVATTQQTRVDLAEEAADALQIYPAVARKVRRLVSALSKERSRRDRGKEYDRVLAPYFLALGRVLSSMHDHLLPGARCAWIVGDSAPYGVYVDTPALIADLAEELGYLRGSDVLLRNRGQRWRTNGTRHQVVLSERVVTFTRDASGRGKL